MDRSTRPANSRASEESATISFMRGSLKIIFITDGEDTSTIMESTGEITSKDSDTEEAHGWPTMARSKREIGTWATSNEAKMITTVLYLTYD